VILAFDARQDLFDVVEAAHQARPQVETLGTERPARRAGTVHPVQPAPERLIDQHLERPALLPDGGFQPGGHVVVQREGCPYDVMLCP